MMSSLGLQALAAISVPKWVPPLVLQLLTSKTPSPPLPPLVDGVEQVHEEGIKPESVSGILLVLLGRKCVYLYFYKVLDLPTRKFWIMSRQISNVVISQL